jgi:hypothetical protein
VNANRAQLHIVDAAPVDTPADTPADTDTASSGDRELGPMEKAITEDLAEINTDQQVPFHRSLSVLALALAREVDDPEASSSARASASGRLFEVLKSLRTRKEGDGTTALDAYLEEFGVPLVPGRPA